jgi:cytoskeletal protein CcmA (bactofilin family)
MAADATAGFRPDQENAVYVGAGVTVKGEVSAPDLIVVDGLVEGEVSARLVIVGQSGVIRGHISAAEADVSGLITDHIEISELLAVRSTGRVEGRVIYREIELEKGAVVTGDLSATEEDRAAAKPVAKRAPQERQERPRQERQERQEHVEIPAAPAGKTSAALERLNEGARAATRNAAKGASAEAEAERRNVLRAPISSRRGRSPAL